MRVPDIFVLVLIAASLTSAALIDLQLLPSDVYIDNWSTSTLTDVVIDTARPQFSWQIAAEFDANGNRIRGITQTHYRLTINRIDAVTTAVLAEPLVDTGIHR